MLGVKLASVIELFSRQVIVRDVGIKGMTRLLSSKVTVLGCGATGSTISELLARAGVGFIRIVDRDVVELSNLPRTHLLTAEDVKLLKPKAVACATHLRELLGITNVESVITEIDPSNIESLVSDTDLIIDGSDNFGLRYLINDIAVKLNKPWIYVGVEGWYGSVMFIKPYETPCLRCIIIEPPPEVGNACEVLGVMNVAVSTTASVAATIALKYLLGLDVDNGYIFIDCKDLSIRKVMVSRNPGCPVCGLNRFEFLGKGREVVKIICGSNSIQILPKVKTVIEFSKIKEFKEIGDNYEVLQVSDYVAKLRVMGYDLILFTDGRMMIMGLTDEKEAEAIYNDVMRRLGYLGIVSYY